METACHACIYIYTSYRDEAQQRRQSLEKESRDEILVQIGELEAQKKVLVALQSGRPSQELVDEFQKLKTSLLKSNTELTRFASTTETNRQNCLISRIKAKANGTFDNAACQIYADSAAGASETVNSNTELFACVSDLDFQINSFEESREALNRTVQLLEDQIASLQDRLATTDVKFSHLARDAQHAADSQDQLDSKWLSFSFDSKSDKSESSTSYSQSSSRLSVGFSGGGGLWSVSGSYSRTKSNSEYSFEASMNSAEVLVSGQLLRVTVQRPWFRPSLFKNSQFQLRRYEAVCLPTIDYCSFIHFLYIYIYIGSRRQKSVTWYKFH